MLPWLRKIGTEIKRYGRKLKDDAVLGGANDPHVWYRDLEKHRYGELSFAVVQGNAILEDQSQVESGSDATFVGVYDGHAGPEAANFIYENLYPHFIRLVEGSGALSEDVLRRAIATTEDGFLSVVREKYDTRQLFATIGSCCLVGVIWKGTLYVANLGDSRAVLGYLDGSNQIVAEQLTKEHNVCIEEVRQELMASHPDDPEIVFVKNGAWRIKGIIQVSRAIGDAYLKIPEFSISPSHPRFHLPEPLRQPILTAEPSIMSRVLEPNDNFLIFASDGLWEHMTSEEAVEVVHKNPRRGIARRLLKKVLTVAAKNSGKKYGELKKIERHARRAFHDDITVVVVFIDNNSMGERGKNISVPDLSIRGFMDNAGSSSKEGESSEQVESSSKQGESSSKQGESSSKQGESSSKQGGSSKLQHSARD
ncbi:probable protein phosphatase 2C 43 [Cornus florida]|uniref:probable protein phosphatase 2C 43 n=1 Tax=Cornus florida TaxID=4283 RepID=UPI0028979113|nr:probable protein phosphatase 2C 43 [Cornus florida]